MRLGPDFSSSFSSLCCSFSLHSIFLSVSEYKNPKKKLQRERWRKVLPVKQIESGTEKKKKKTSSEDSKRNVHKSGVYALKDF